MRKTIPISAIKDKLIHILTEYDKKQSRKKDYNRHALGQYVERADLICKDIEAGTSFRSAIIKGFNDRLVDFILRKFDLPTTTTEETNSSFIYRS